MLHPEVVVLGSINVDQYRLPDGRTYEFPGGKGLNQAVAAARTGASVALVGRVGTDADGDALLASLATEGVETDFVVRDSAEPTGRCRIELTHPSAKPVVLAIGANARVSASDVEAAEAALQSAVVIVLLAQMPSEAVRRALRYAGGLVLLDPSPPLVADWLYDRIDLIKPDSEEAEALTGLPSIDEPTARRAARKLRQRGVPMVALEGGREGNVFSWNGREEWLPRLPVNPVDSTGAGDAMLGTLAGLIALGKALEQAIPVACRAAAHATLAVGGTHPIVGSRSQ